MDNPIFKQIEDVIFVPKKKTSFLGPVFIILTLGIIGIVAFAYLSDNSTSTQQETKSPQSIQEQRTDTGTFGQEINGNLPFPLLTKNEISGKKAKLITSKGEIIFNLSSDAPIASSNFIFLTEKKFYNGLTFHRREEGFVIQGGDPIGNGTGGPGYTFQDEPVVGEYNRGTVAMANAGPNTNGSQFFIMLANTPNLPKSYTIFGNVISGMEVVDKIQIGDKINSITIN